MNKSDKLYIRINPETKKKADKLYSGFGITISDAVNMFLTKSVMVGGLPFDLKYEDYNTQTKEALKEAKELAEGIAAGSVTPYSDIDTMLGDLNA